MWPRAIVQILFLLALPWAGPPAAAQPAPSPASLSRSLESALRESSFREAEEAADRIMALGPLDATSLAMAGLAYLKVGRFREAESLFSETLATSPRHPEAHLGLGRLARMRNDHAGAVEHLRLATGSHVLRDEAFRQLWRAMGDKGIVQEMLQVRELAGHRYGRASEPLPAWIARGIRQVEGLEGAILRRMTGRFEALEVPLLPKEGSTIRMISLKLDGKGGYPFDVDSASPGFMTISPLLAEELGLKVSGSSSAVGVGTDHALVRFSVVRKAELGGVAFRDIPVMVSSLATFRGKKKGLLGTGFLKRFNVTLDAEAGLMRLYPLERPDLLEESIQPGAVAADVPLYLFEAATVKASLNGAPPALYILDTAAGTHLVDAAFLEEHLEPALAAGQITSSTITGSQGPQETRKARDLTVTLGELTLEGQSAHEFRMDALNAIPGRYAAGLLGNPVLWPYRVHMDFRRGRLILEERPPEPGD